MNPFEIWDAVIMWRGCGDRRPCLVIRVNADGSADVFPISTACYSGEAFEIDSRHDDFVATGLKKDCFIHDTHYYTIKANQFHKHRGSLTNALLAAFREYSGT